MTLQFQRQELFAQQMRDADDGDPRGGKRKSLRRSQPRVASGLNPQHKIVIDRWLVAGWEKSEGSDEH